jgi:hypothetical protein
MHLFAFAMLLQSQSVGAKPDVVDQAAAVVAAVVAKHDPKEQPKQPEPPKQAEPPKQEPGITLLTAKQLKIVFYGFLRLDILYDTDRPNNVQVPSFILSEDTPPGGENDLSIHPRLTRFGLDLDGPTIEMLGGAKLTGKLEIDFYNLLPGSGVITSNSREFVRMRHAWLKLGWEAFSLQIGQRDDVIAPLVPTPNNDLVMWNAGNLADRRPQVRAEYASSGFTVTGMIGLTGAVDGRDLDSNGFLDGESSGLPTLQARFGYAFEGWVEKAKIAIGAWGHYAKEDPDSDVSGEDSFTSNAFGIDLTLPVHARVTIKLEAWTGKNLDDVRGGIGQGVVAGEEVSAVGGWLEVAFKATDWWTPVLGVYLDDPDEDELPASGAPDRNFIVAWANRFQFGPLELGADILYWNTEFTGSVDDGTDIRLNFFAALHF